MRGTWSRIVAGTLIAGSLLASPLALGGADAAQVGGDRVTIQIGFDAHGEPASPTAPATLVCGDEILTAEVPYGRHWVVDVPADVGMCEFSHLDPDATTTQLARFIGNEWEYLPGPSLSFDPSVVRYLWVFAFHPSPWSDLELFVRQLFLDIADRQPTDAELSEALREVMVEGRDVSQVVMRIVEDVGHYTDSVERIGRLYRAVFLRAADPDGLDYWVAAHRAGMPLIEIAELFASSAEFERLYDIVDDAEYVALAYWNVFVRPADRDGGRYWMGEMEAGLSRGGVMTWFSESQEFRSRVNRSILIEWTVATFLTRPATVEDHAALSADYRYGTEAVLVRVLTSSEYFHRFWYQGRSDGFSVVAEGTESPARPPLVAEPPAGILGSVPDRP